LAHRKRQPCVPKILFSTLLEIALTLTGFADS
jgi:hypothetical protein